MPIKGNKATYETIEWRMIIDRLFSKKRDATAHGLASRIEAQIHDKDKFKASPIITLNNDKETKVLRKAVKEVGLSCD